MTRKGSLEHQLDSSKVKALQNAAGNQQSQARKISPARRAAGRAAGWQKFLGTATTAAPPPTASNLKASDESTNKLAAKSVPRLGGSNGKLWSSEAKTTALGPSEAGKPELSKSKSHEGSISEAGAGVSFNHDAAKFAKVIFKFFINNFRKIKS